MKILNIHFKNINSLEGESRIDFEQAPFLDTGVFAITGSNGSGKTSILDAITLGLYGETFRFDRPAKHVMTQHTTECFSEIEFIFDQVKYRSNWHVERIEANPKGDLMTPEMKLIRLTDNQVLATTCQQVCAWITKITGMNFRNFTRSIMLAQGDFATFLNALDNERMDILEKIISANIYTDFKDEVNKKAADAQQRLDYLKQDLSILPIMDAGMLKACEHDLNDFIEQTNELQEEQSTLKQQQTSLLNRLALQSRIADQEKNLQQTKILVANNQQKHDQLVAAQDALLFKDDALLINEKTQLIQQEKTSLTTFLDELKQIQNRIGTDKKAPEGLSHQSVTEQGQVIVGLKIQIGQLTAQRQSESDFWQSLSMQINEKTSVLTTVSTWLEENRADELLLDNFPEIGRLKKIRGDLAELKEKQKALTKWSRNTTTSLKNNKFSIEQENKRIIKLKHQLPQVEVKLNELAQGKKLAELEDFQHEQQERVKDFQELYNLSKANRKLSQGSFSFFGIFNRNEKPDYHIKELEGELETLKLEISREENIKLTLDMTLTRETLLKKMASDRHHLVDDEPCFLCGALEHPYAEQPPKAGNSQQALTDQKAKIKTLMAEMAKVTKQIKTAQKIEEKNQTNQTGLLKLRSQWLTLCNRLNSASEDLNINKLRLIKGLLNTEINELKAITSVVAEYRKVQASIEQVKALIIKSEATVERLQLNTQQLDSEWQKRHQEVTDYDAVLAACEHEEQQLSKKVLAQLTLLGEKVPPKNKEDALFDRLNVRRQDYQSHIFRQKSLTLELETLSAKAKQCRAEIAACNEKIEHYHHQLQNEEIIGLHLALIEKQKLIADKEHTIAKQEVEISLLRQTLQDKLQGTQFASLHQLTEIFKLLECQPELELQLLKLKQDIDTKTIGLENSQLELEAEDKLITTDFSPEQLDALLKTTAEKIEIAKMEIQRLEHLLKEQSRHAQQAESIITQLQNQEEVARLCNAEAAQIAEENGIDFRRRVQKRVAEQLLSQTNAILEKISGRYYLRQIPSNQGLALEIEDTYQNNARRLPKTLSGGESFVVSLALALGLSELANNGKSVDSLFLDEGFGNLDAETLYTVISTLENLHIHGKTVGVISHVEAVQKRFKTRLQVIKKPNGMGTLKQMS